LSSGSSPICNTCWSNRCCVGRARRRGCLGCRKRISWTGCDNIVLRGCGWRRVVRSKTRRIGCLRRRSGSGERCRL